MTATQMFQCTHSKIYLVFFFIFFLYNITFEKSQSFVSISFSFINGSVVTQHMMILIDLPWHIQG